MIADTDRQNLKISTRVMYDEFVRQGVPVKIIDSTTSLLEYKDVSGEPRMLFSTKSEKASAAGAAIARSKVRTAMIAKSLGINTPKSSVCSTLEEAIGFFESHGRVVVKPISRSGGVGITTDVTTLEQLRLAFDYARNFSLRVIVQEHLEGDDIRLLVVAGEFCSAVRRIPAHVVGDGASSIRSLIDKENKSGSRQAKATSAMDMISIEDAERYLSTDIQRVPGKGEVVRVMGPANLSMGGTVEEATNIVTYDMICDAEKISDKLKLGICGVDMIWNRQKNQYALIEVNATPGVNMHNDFFWGTSSDAIEKYVKWLIV